MKRVKAACISQTLHFMHIKQRVAYGVIPATCGCTLFIF